MSAEYKSLVAELQQQLSKACQDRGALLYCVKQAYLDQAHPRSILAVSLLEEIRKHDPTWEPPPVNAGRYESNGTKGQPAAWVPKPKSAIAKSERCRACCGTGIFATPEFADALCHRCGGKQIDPLVRVALGPSKLERGER